MSSQVLPVLALAYRSLKGKCAEMAAPSPGQAPGEAAPARHGAAKGGMRGAFTYFYETQRSPFGISAVWGKAPACHLSPNKKKSKGDMPKAIVGGFLSPGGQPAAQIRRAKEE